MQRRYTTRRTANRNAQPLKFDKRLVLNQWILRLFEVDSFDSLVTNLKDPDLETYDADNVSRIFWELTNRTVEHKQLSNDLLRGYDENIFKHTLTLNGRRKEPLRWKYFQYLALLFTEIYLDRFFSNPDTLLRELNSFVQGFNEDKGTQDQVALYQPQDLRKLAFWSATGSGKTLVMHANILQYRHYLDKHGKLRDLNRIILLTPNEGLSRQHLDEFSKVGMAAELFDKERGSLFAGHLIEVIDIHKLAEESGDKTVAVESFEGNNLVLVDEGHRGASTDTWKGRRDQLCEQGFSFEYSATFGQMVATARDKALTDEYSKCILFDFSYRYFYNDGYGKEYRILNLAVDRRDESRLKYLTACTMAFFQQLLLFGDKRDELIPWLIERPLWVFVGGSVTKEVSTKDISDVVDILLFLSSFLHDRKAFVQMIDLLLRGTHGLLNTQGHLLFSNTFTYFIERGLTAEVVYDEILKRVFNAPGGGALHVEHLKGSAGEVALRVGDNEPFGVINVGDPTKLCKICEGIGDRLVVGDREFSESLFEGINKQGSTLQLLIGSKKFSEGWSSWRVSTMGLMNVGKSEGAQIIQLFGRGVRLKGYDHGLKRSDFVENLPEGIKKPRHLREVETLNIFGIQAGYMEEFKKFLEEEGLPSDEDRIEFLLPTFQSLGTQKLKTLQLPGNLEFKKDAPKPQLKRPGDLLHGRKVVVDWYPKIQSRLSVGVRTAENTAILNEGALKADHLAFFDWDEVFTELQEFKNERTWFNLALPRESLPNLLSDPSWYTLYIPPDMLLPNGYGRVRLWQEIAVVLLKKYADTYYKARKAEWEGPQLIYTELRPDDPNFVTEYRFMLEQSEEEIHLRLNEIKEAVESRQMVQCSFDKLQDIWFSQHLYQPLIYLNSSLIQVSPVHLNEGERDFVLHLRSFYDTNKPFFSDKELYLLRNRSKGRGLGFFEAANFHPDFILWLVVGPKQYVTFVDPKGLRNLDGGINNPKIQFYRTVKELEKPHLDPNIVLNSFIISASEFSALGWNSQPPKEEFESHHVLFQKDDEATYIGKMLERVER